jgi:HPt (histidine-containing phosphotransfer) domain-containing protein
MRKRNIKVPIIALTANVMADAKEMMLNAGLNDFLGKPILNSELTKVLSKWLPPEKLLELPVEIPVPREKVGKEKEAFWEAIYQINGLNVSDGLDRLRGERSVYEKTLRLLVQENEKSVKKLIKFLSDNDMENFRIEVHGLKGTLDNVGVTQLSKKAYELEIASGKTDVEFCGKKLPELIEGLSKINLEITEAFALIVQSESDIKIPPELPPIFQKMIKAFDDYDLMSVRKEMENIKVLNLTDILSWKIDLINEAVILMDYDEAKRQIQKLLGNL